MEFRIKELRTEKKLSQTALANLVGASQKAVDFWENKINEPKASYLINLANVFNCSIDYLVGREDDFGNVQILNDMTKDEKELLHFYRNSGKTGRQVIFVYASGVYDAYKQSLKL